jgi:uncharacterized protein YqjF (DUF2071 family)
MRLGSLLIVFFFFAAAAAFFTFLRAADFCFFDATLVRSDRVGPSSLHNAVLLTVHMSVFVDPTNDIAHRPWPLPKRPWMMTQRWSDLLFMHWPAQTAVIRALVPHDIDLDLHSGTAWVTVAPFYLDHLRVRGLPMMPWGSAFTELNVRTYVSMGGKPGVYFFSLDASSPLAVTAARTLFQLPYFRATMRARTQSNGRIDYESDRVDGRAHFAASYGPTGTVALAERGSLDHWLTERYCLYTTDRGGRVLRAEIHHAQWPLQPAHADVRVNSMLQAAGMDMPAIEPRLSFVRQLDVVVWPPRRVR